MNSAFMCLPSDISGACCVESTIVSQPIGLRRDSERHLALGVRAQRREGAVLAHNALTLDETVGVVIGAGMRVGVSSQA